MIAMTDPCLQASEIADLLAGKLSRAGFEVFSQHLDRCATCRTSAEALGSERGLASDSLLQISSDDNLHNETACQIAIARLLDPANHQAPSPVSAAIIRCLGPYQMLATLGHGGMGTVYLAEHQRLHRKCAIKLLPRERVNQPGWLERFDREMTAIASLEHPHIVRATDAGHEDGWHYLVMEYLDGLDIGRIASRLGIFPFADACEIVRQAALGLAQIHARGLVHRDVKPSNMMLTRDGIVKLLDLGLVLDGDDPLASDERLTTVGHLMGTMSYMAPEQLIDSRGVGAAADIYALGTTLYRLLCGRSPHPGGRGIASQVLAITQQAPTPIKQLRPEIDDELVGLIDRMLHREPGDRPAATSISRELEQHVSAANLKALLKTALAKVDQNEAVASSFASLPPAPAQPPRFRRPWLVAVGFFAASLFLAGWLLKLQTETGELVIQSDSPGATVIVRQGEKLIERLEVQAGKDNHITLRQGTYIVEAEGSGFELSDNRVVITGSDVALTKVSRKQSANSDNTNQRLYQGRDLAHWMNVLGSEQDAIAIGVAMRAVELLSRDTEQRAAAVSRTLDIAKRLGGMNRDNSDGPISNSAPAQSERYMRYLFEIFPSYLPEPGLDALDQQLMEGNDLSRMSAAWLLSNFLYGINVDTSNTERKNVTHQYLKSLSNTTEGRKQLQQLVDHLGILMIGTQTTDVADTAINSWQQPFSEHTAWSAARRLLAIEGHKLETPDWVPQYVINLIEQRTKNYEKRDTSQESISRANALNTRADWLVPADVFIAALELHRQGSLQLSSNFATDVITNPKFDRSSNPEYPYLQTVAAQWPDATMLLLARIKLRLDKLESHRFDHEVVQDLRTDLSWRTELPFCATHEPDSQSLLQRINRLRDLEKAFKGSPSRQAKADKEATMRAINEAIAILESREAQAGRSPKAEPAMLAGDTPSVVIEAKKEIAETYQSKTLDQWIDILNRERDLTVIGPAMQAIEVLSRNTNRREEAAIATLIPASTLGGSISTIPGSIEDAKNNPSLVYMGYLDQLLPRYEPDPAFRAIDRQLADGNLRFRLAAIRISTTCFVEPSFCAYVQQAAHDEGENLALLQHLINGFRFVVEPTFKHQANYKYISENIWRMTTYLQSKSKGKLDSPPWMTQLVIDQVAEATVAFDNPQTFAFVMTGKGMWKTNSPVPVWRLNKAMFGAALELQRKQQLKISVELAIANLTDTSNHDREIDPANFRMVSEQLPEALPMLMSAIENRLAIYCQSDGPNLHDHDLINRTSGYWTSALPFYATDVMDVTTALNLLTRLKETKLGEEIARLVDAAIATLEKRR